MKKKPIYTAIFAVVMFGGLTSSNAHSTDAIDAGGFGNAKLTSMKPVKKADKECLSFEASFSQSLDKSPTAMLDIERHFTNLLNAFLEVTKISDKKYRLALTASTDQGCPTVEDESRLTISTYSGSESKDDRQVLPASVTFTADKSAKLKKE
jgi:hypothetical protein